VEPPASDVHLRVGDGHQVGKWGNGVGEDRQAALGPQVARHVQRRAARIKHQRIAVVDQRRGRPPDSLLFGLQLLLARFKRRFGHDQPPIECLGEDSPSVGALEDALSFQLVQIGANAGRADAKLLCQLVHAHGLAGPHPFGDGL
jgi:hypothetical protein